MSLRDELIAEGYKQNDDGDWVKNHNGMITSTTYSKDVVDADDAIIASKERTDKRYFNVYTGPVMCGPESPVIVVDGDATDREIKDFIIEEFGDRVWKVYETDDIDGHEVRMW